MRTRYLPDPVRFRSLSSAELREAFVLDDLFAPGQLTLFAVDTDRAVLAGAVPTTTELRLEAPAALRATAFCERRELGVVNLGGPGAVIADGQHFTVEPRGFVYVGRGTRAVSFTSADPAAPATFFLVSFPAHAAFPSAAAGSDQARTYHLGTAEEANRRVLRQVIHPEGIRSCQLVMGYTDLQPGSVWNTMPPHTRPRRCEIYLYFDMEPDARVLHVLGPPDETRHVMISDRQAVVSPPWSVHFGAGTGRYAFVWAMGGENQAFEDMDSVPVVDLR